jgi:TfoX/Sxy family transcriptional regulator of competence genes
MAGRADDEKTQRVDDRGRGARREAGGGGRVMAFDEKLAGRVRRALATERAEEKRMFGGLCFLVRGHMALGIVGDELMVRVGRESYEAALAEPHAREMDFTGRPLRGMVYVGQAGLATPAALRRWVSRGAAHARSLPPKASPAKPRRRVRR